MSRRAQLASVAGAGLLLAAGGMWLVTQPPGDAVGTVPADRTATSSASVPSPAVRAGDGALPVRPGALPRRAAALQPTRVVIPAIGVDAPVVAVGVRADGQMQVPSSVDTVGWYRHGPGLDGPTGSVVIAGHVDSATRGKGAFFRLREMSPGSWLSVVGNDGRTRAYRVTARRVWAKTEVPLADLFARDGPPRLVLITCGGSFDRAGRSYRDNVVVTAEAGA